MRLPDVGGYGSSSSTIATWSGRVAGGAGRARDGRVCMGPSVRKSSASGGAALVLPPGGQGVGERAEAEVAQQAHEPGLGAPEVDVVAERPQPAGAEARLAGVELPGVQVGGEGP